jgi:hypothetical protein
MKNIKRGSKKHKGKLPFTCFNYGRVGHFATKCPYAKREDSDDEENNRGKYYRHKKGKYTKKRSFYSREDSSSSKESDGYVSDIDKEEFLFMAMCKVED